MRLPTTDRKPMSKKIDEKRATRMIRHAIDKGVNYVDNAYPYHGGKSEAFLGKALRDGYRDKVRLATKCPVWLMKRPSDFDKYLDQQLKRLRTDTIDFYLFHALHEKAWKNKIVKLKLLDRAERAIDAGKIGHIGFSFHDTYKVFKEIVDGYDGWEFCQIQYNYLDTVNQGPRV
jgi:predicted aldo/keto reductase-like oxidoreductase